MPYKIKLHKLPAFVQQALDTTELTYHAFASIAVSDLADSVNRDPEVARYVAREAFNKDFRKRKGGE